LVWEGKMQHGISLKSFEKRSRLIVWLYFEIHTILDESLIKLIVFKKIG